MNKFIGSEILYRNKSLRGPMKALIILSLATFSVWTIAETKTSNKEILNKSEKKINKQLHLSKISLDNRMNKKYLLSYGIGKDLGVTSYSYELSQFVDDLQSAVEGDSK